MLIFPFASSHLVDFVLLESGVVHFKSGDLPGLLIDLQQQRVICRLLPAWIFGGRSSAVHFGRVLVYLFFLAGDADLCCS